MVDVREIIAKYTVEELCQESDNYFKRMPSWDALLAKPLSIPESQHLLVEFAHLVHGLKLAPGMIVLDFGCGSAWTSRFLNQMGCSVISLDVSSTALEIGKKLKESHKVFGKQPEHTFLLFDGRTIDLPDNSVDRIFCLEAFHHVPNQSEILHEMARVLKQGGIAGFSEPGPHHSTDNQSQFEMTNFRVIENDIVLDDIYPKALKAGFTDIKVSVSGLFPFIVSLNESQHFLKDKKLISEYLNRTEKRMKNFPIFFLYTGSPPDITDSRNGEGLTAEIFATPHSISVHEDDKISIRLDISNISKKSWLPSGLERGCVNLGGFLYGLGKDGTIVTVKELRCHLSDSVIMPGGSISVEFPVEGLKAGHYRLEIDLLSESICWFQFNGSKKTDVEIIVDER
jgi:ubiquinone/menaquinone biosynthesis C-methylase UbiE